MPPRPTGRRRAPPLVEEAGEDQPGQPAAGVGHVVEADVHRDLVVVCVGEDEVRVDGGVHREDDAERAQADDERDRRVGSGAQRDRDAGWEPGEQEREPDRGAAARLRVPATRAGSRAPMPARSRSRSPRSRGTRRPARSSSRASCRGRPATRPRTRRPVRRTARLARGRAMFTARLLENIWVNLAFRSTRPSVPRISVATAATATTSSTSRIRSAGRKPVSGQQQAADEEADALERVLRAGQDRYPAEERGRCVRRDDELDGALRAHLGEVLGDPGERLGRHHVGDDQPRLGRRWPAL